MIYRKNPKNGDELSALAYGCMRLPRNDKEAEVLILAAIDKGINYFDTTYFYPGNEAQLGRILQTHGLRQKVNIATKCPQFRVAKGEDFDRFFTTELERLQTDFIDYYLMHTLTSFSQWERLVALGVGPWAEEKKAQGKIRQFGFSFHGGTEEFIKIVDAYPWDFCMIQYNYLDENNQAGLRGLRYAGGKGLPVMVMEPLQGGRLATGLPEEVVNLWKEADASRTPAEWALRWVWNHPQVLTVLSGMATMEALEENLRIAAQGTAQSLTEQELSLFEKARRIILSNTKVPCTGCAYCMPCPFGVNIPLCFDCYNLSARKSRLQAMTQYINYVWDQNASKCQKCGKCEEHCPQSIPIREKLGEVKAALEAFPYMPARFVVKRVLNRQ